MRTKLLRIAILGNNYLMTIFPCAKSLLLVLLCTYSDFQHIMIIVKICFHPIVYPFHRPKSYTLSICFQLAFEYHCYVFSNFNLRNEIIKMKTTHQIASNYPLSYSLPVLAPQILPYHISKTFNFQALNLSLLNVRGLQILKFCRPFNNYSESDNLICIS